MMYYLSKYLALFIAIIFVGMSATYGIGMYEMGRTSGIRHGRFMEHHNYLITLIECEKQAAKTDVMKYEELTYECLMKEYKFDNP